MYSLAGLKYETETVNSEKVSELEPKINFLFVVYNEIEMSEMQSVLEPLQGFGVILDYIEQDCMQHFFIGKFFKYNIVLAKTSDMGSKNVNSVGNVINRAIQIFKPRYIVMPGIAAGLDNNIKIGDIVIADKIIGYESEKIAPTEIIGRYPEFRSPRLFNLFCSLNVRTINSFLKTEIQTQIKGEATTGLKIKKPDCKTNCPQKTEQEFSLKEAVTTYGYPKVYTGNYVSGEKLLDNPTYRNFLKMKFKEAMALDMEGLGVASASSFNRVYDWIVIKGISDLGDGNKGTNKTERQIFAMKNVISVLKKIFDDSCTFQASNLKQPQDCFRKNVLISGSQCKDGDFYDLTSDFMETLAKQLIVNQFNLINGYGIGVGPAVLLGVFEGCEELGIPLREYTERFKCLAFPRKQDEDNKESKENGNEAKLEKYKSKNRQILCANAEIAIFAFGNKKGADRADGMFDERDMVLKNNALILPIGCTGGTAKEIYQSVISNDGIEVFLKPYFCERKKFRVRDFNLDEEIKNYVDKLKSLNEIELNKDNVGSVVQTVIELINFYG